MRRLNVTLALICWQFGERRGQIKREKFLEIKIKREKTFTILPYWALENSFSPQTNKNA